MNDYTLKDLIKINNGKDYRHLEDGAIPVYGSGGVMCHVNDYLYDGECILLPRKGTLDNIMYVSGKFWTVDTMYWATVNEEIADTRYLYLYLTQLDLSNLDTGSTLPSMTNDTYNMVPVKLPELSAQRDIADKIFAIRDKISNNTAICSDLEAMAKLLYDYWFVQFDFPDENGKPYKSSGGKMVWNEELKREIPEGWDVKPFKAIANFTMGQSPKGDSYNLEKKGLPLLNGAVELAKDGIHIEKYTEEYTRTCTEGDWLFCIRATLGNIHPAKGTYCLGRGVAAATPSSDEYKEYVFFTLDNMISYFEKSLSGSIIVGMTKDDIVDYPVITPPIQTIRSFHDSVRDMFINKELCVDENQQLASLRDFLLPMLMNGQVKVC